MENRLKRNSGWRKRASHGFKKGRINHLLWLFIGLAALVWFAVRVIPKPSRATYPCQRAAFPLASGFIIWLISFIISVFSIRKAGKLYRSSGRRFSFLYLLPIPVILALVQLPGSIRIAYAAGGDAAALQLKDDHAGEGVVLPEAQVAIVRSSEERAQDIQAAEIDQMVRQAVQLAGGFGDLISEGDVVVIKPNLVNPSQEGKSEPLPREVNGVDTDYRVIQAVVNLVREKNQTGKVMIMEGSAFGKTIDNMEKLGWLDITGVDHFIGIEDSSGSMRDYSSDKLVKRSLPPGKNLYSPENNTYYLNRTYAEADVVISLPVLKTHSSAAFTGAVKNVAVGTTPASIYGDESGATNLRWPYINHDNSINSPLHDWIHDYYMCRPVDFVIMDALTGLELGPGIAPDSNPDDVRKNTRCILAGKDAVALDAIGALAVQVDPARVSYLISLHNDGMGCADPRYIRIHGWRLDQIRGSYRNIATYAKYTQVSPPRFIIQSYEILKDTLHLDIVLKSRVDKFEFAVNDTLLDPVFTDGFDDLRVPLGREVSAPQQIKIYAYDNYLNCAVKMLQDPTGAFTPKEMLSVLEVYPNPFTSLVTVSLTGIQADICRITLHDLTGKLIRTCQFNVDGKDVCRELNLSDLPAGIYILTALAGDQSMQKKIIRQ